MMKLKWFFTVLAVFVLGACSLAPKYSRPAAPVPSGWPTGTAYKVTEAPAAPAAADLKWQDFYTDARLRQVIETVLKNSRDIRLAALNVERARGLYGIQRAELLPSVNAAGSYARQRIAADQSSSGNASVTEQYTVSLGVAAWELDFFGRIRSLKDRALEEFFATDQARLSTQILLMSEAANAWLTLAADRENLKLARSTLEAQEASWKLIRRRYDLGMASELDLQRIQSQVDTARGEVARFMQLEALDENALNLLAGTTLPPELLPNDLAGVSPPRDFSAGLSSEMLLRRPDVLAAEHQLKAANANIGAARAAFLPRISLTTSIGSASADLGGLFKTGSGIWSFAPVAAVPIFDARTWSAYDVTKAEREIMIARYEKAIQSAFRDVADALAVKGTVDRRIEAQESLVRAFSETYRLANLRYEKGIDSYLSVLDAQRSLFGAQQGLIALYRARMSNQVTLYGVLGGGVQ
ncbi:MAG TPA: efflux transporter outer membrane subunit [Syntrophales bacterium]|nr:efflux transporter outer membrane subunit [Syntrophales bacterium]